MMAAKQDSKLLTEPIAVQGYHLWWKILSMVICVFALSVSVYGLFISSGGYTALGYSSFLVIPIIFPSAAYAVLALEVRVYSDRVERRRFRTTVVFYDDIERIHLTDLAPERISVYEEGMSYYPAISIHNGLADWRALGEALMAEIPDTVEITGSEELRAELTRG